MTPPLTHQQIADMVGTSRETVTRAVKQLKEKGWLDIYLQHLADEPITENIETYRALVMTRLPLVKPSKTPVLLWSPLR